MKDLKEENEKLRKDNEELKKENKESLIDNISKKLLKLEFKSDHSIKWKCLKWIVKKILSDYKK